jgi:16S rRNA processing protein RimM
MSDPGLDELLEVGLVVKPHGVLGQLAVRPHNPHSLAFEEEALEIYIDMPGRETKARVKRLGQSRGNLLISVEGIRTRDQAEAMRGQRVFIAKTALELDEGEYLYADLEGCGIWQGDQNYGKVVQIFESGASDILVVRDANGERMIPMVEPWLKSVDVSSKRIEIEGIEQFEVVEPRKK